MTLRRRFLPALLLLCLGPTLLRAQQPEEGVARHAVKVNILSPLAGSPSVSYELRLGRRWGAQFDLGGTLLRQQDAALTPYGLFVQPQVRLYLNDQRRRGVMPFVALGLNYMHAWEHADLFVRNEGWTIVTHRHTLRDDLLRPSFIFGLKVNIPFGLTLESQVGFLLYNRERDLHVDGQIDAVNYLSTLINTRIGWAF